MSNQPEALRLADAMDRQFLHACANAATELRRLHEQNERLEIVAGMSTLLLDQRAALLEALKEAEFVLDDCPMVSRQLIAAIAKARAAIKLVEGEKE